MPTTRIAFKTEIGGSFFVGPEVEVHLVSRNGNKIKFAVDAPHDVVILRREVYERLVGQGETPFRRK